MVSTAALPEYQDTITPNIIFARQDTQGLYNAASEVGFAGSHQPGIHRMGDRTNAQPTRASTIAATNYCGPYLHQTGSPRTETRSAITSSAHRPWSISLPKTSTSTSNSPVGPTPRNRRTRWLLVHARGPAGGGTLWRLQRRRHVNAADYTIWRDTLGQSVANPGDGADGDLSSTIDSPDYDHWKARFGNLVPGVGGVAAVS